MKRILIIKLSALGDIVQAEGAIRDIRNYHHNDHLVIMTTPPYRKIMERCPWVDEVFIDPRDSRWRLDKMFLLRKRLQSLSVDSIYDLQQVGRTNFYLRWFFNSSRKMNALPVNFHNSPNTPTQCMADRFALQFDTLGIPAMYSKKSDLSWMAADMQHYLRKKKITSPYIVLIPGSSRGHDAKRWPFFGELASWLRKKGKVVVTVPGPDELDLCSTFTDATMLTDNGRYLDVFELSGILQQAEFIIGNDTGPTHIGAYLNIPGIAMFGSHIPPLMTGIQHSRFSWIEKKDLRNLSLKEMQDILIHSPVLSFQKESTPA